MQHAYELLKKVQDTIDRHNMLKHGDKVLVGVSAGPDSVCLLHILNDLQVKYNLSLYIAHLHHGFRGSEADEDVQFVQAMGESLRIPVHIEYADIPSYIKKAGLSKQAGAREVRYQFFYRVADETGADRIALGHTADDQVETFLMRLLRGSGSLGLSGIPPVRERIIRPLIDIYREEIRQFLSERGIRYRIDSSNLSATYLRNKIRLELIPYLSKEFNPNIMDTVLRNLKILRDEESFLDENIRKIYPDMLLSASKESVTFDVRKYASLAMPVRRRMLRHAVEAITGEGAVALSFRHIEDSLSLLGGDKEGEVHLPCGFMVKRDREAFGVYLKPGKVPVPPYTYDVAIPGDTLVPEAGITISTAILDGSTYEKRVEGDDPYKAFFDLGKFSFPLIIRGRKKGDLFCPKGMAGRKKKIKEYFIDRKIPRKERDKIPVLVSPEGILWVVGYRTDERFRITSDTKQILQVKASKKAA